MVDRYPFELIPLEYPYNALEPYIDEQTMQLHHDKHLKAYVDNLNETLRGYPRYQNWSLERLLINLNRLPVQLRTPIRHNGGGVYNHNLFFHIMGSNGNVPSGKVLKAINRNFGSFDKFKEQFKKAAQGVFGSGYAWLLTDKNGNMRIKTTPNQDTPLTEGSCPLLLIDVWEHAYYLKYKNLRGDYIGNWFNVINWNKVERIFEECLRQGKK